MSWFISFPWTERLEQANHGVELKLAWLRSRILNAFMKLTWENCTSSPFQGMAIILSREGGSPIPTTKPTLFVFFFWDVSQVTVQLASYNHGEKLLRHVKITNLFPWCRSCSFPLWKVASPSAFFSVGNKSTPTKRFATLFGGRGWLQVRKMFSFKYNVLLFVRKL